MLWQLNLETPPFGFDGMFFEAQLFCLQTLIDDGVVFGSYRISMVMFHPAAEQ